MSTKMSCDMIRDLLPSYLDELTSDESNQAINEHLRSCENCRNELERLKGVRKKEGEERRKAEIAYMKLLRRRQRRPAILIVALALFMAGLVYVFVPLGIGEDSITAQQKASLMEQYVTAEECEYRDFLPDKWVASCLIYGVERKGDKGSIYADVRDEEFVKFKGKAYNMSGGSGPVKINVRFNGDKIRFVSVKYPEDGTYMISSLKKMYPFRFYIRMKFLNACGTVVYDRVEALQNKKIKKLWGASIEVKDLLEVKPNGSYTITRFYGDGTEMKVIERGKLKLYEKR